MVRLLLFLLGKQDFESCKSCETLKLQLELANAEKERLTSTLLDIIKPKTYEASPVQLVESKPVITAFSRRRAALESRDREEARIKQQSKNLAVPDGSNRAALVNPNAGASIETLETELGLDSESAI